MTLAITTNNELTLPRFRTCAMNVSSAVRSIDISIFKRHNEKLALQTFSFSYSYSFFYDFLVVVIVTVN